MANKNKDQAGKKKKEKGAAQPEKTRLHPRNKHRNRYNFAELTASCPELKPFVTHNKYGDESVDFFDPAAVKMLNTALLKHYYGIAQWDIPKDYLCPPVPGRADYLHYMADLMSSSNYGHLPRGSSITCLDVGVGANCVYPLIGNKEYGWSFIGSDIDPVAIENGQKILESNPSLTGTIELRLQNNPRNFFLGIIRENELIDISICNPPFHASAEEAKAATLRKLNNLRQEKQASPVLNFGGRQTELWSPGGEERFVRNMILESQKFSSSVYWFSTLISKRSNLKNAGKQLEKLEAGEIKIIPMGQGNKSSRILAWTFLNKKQKVDWRSSRWKNSDSQ